MGKKGKKLKPPPFWSEPVDVAPFGSLMAKDLVKTPLGIIGTVLGVKYHTKQRGEAGTGKMWVMYQDGFLSPLERDITKYQRMSEADHIWRDIKVMEKELEEKDQVRAIIDEANEKYVGELIAEWEKKNAPKKKKKKAKPKPKPATDAAPKPQA